MDLVLTMPEAIEEENHTRLADLFLVKRDDFDGLQYAPAWSFVYFLQNTPKDDKGFGRSFKALYNVKLKGFKAETYHLGFGDKTGIRKQSRPEDLAAAMLKPQGVEELEKE